MAHSIQNTFFQGIGPLYNAIWTPVISCGLRYEEGIRTTVGIEMTSLLFIARLYIIDSGRSKIEKYHRLLVNYILFLYNINTLMLRIFFVCDQIIWWICQLSKILYVSKFLYHFIKILNSIKGVVRYFFLSFFYLFYINVQHLKIILWKFESNWSKTDGDIHL